MGACGLIVVVIDDPDSQDLALTCVGCLTIFAYISNTKYYDFSFSKNLQQNCCNDIAHKKVTL